MEDFKTFVEQQNRQAADNKREVNAKEKIAFFKDKVKDLYCKIDNEWLKTYIDKHEIRTTEHEIQITEELLGTYSIDEKTIEIGEHTFLLKPVGTILIGTPGRVDLLYKSKQIMFVLVGENVKNVKSQIIIKINNEEITGKKSANPGELVWKYTQRGGIMTYHDLSAESFQKLLMDLING